MPDFSFIIRDKTHAVFASSIGQKALAAVVYAAKNSAKSARTGANNVGFTSTLPPLPARCELDEQADGIQPGEFIFNPGAPADSAKPQNVSTAYRDSAGCRSPAADQSP